MDELRDDFLRWLRTREGFEDATIQVYRRRWSFHLAQGLDVAGFLAGTADALAIGGDFLDKRHGSTGRQGYGNSVRFLNALARFAGHQGVHFAYPRPKPSEPSSFTDDELARFAFYQPRGEVVRIRALSIFQVALATGLRRGELASLDVDDIDLDTQTVYVRAPTKMGKKRSVPLLTADLAAPGSALLSWLRMRPEPSSGALWTRLLRPYVRLSPDHLSMMVQRMGAQVGVRANFYRTRHTFATRCKRAGMDTRDLQVLLGHSSIKSTTVYDDRTGEDVRRSVQGLRIEGLGAC